ncbi:MAG: T9SS type A sorting domain-containing protein, partial [Bacteroidota bacterium]
SDDGRFVYITASSNDGVVVFSRDQTTGILTLLQNLINNMSDGSGNTINFLDLPQVAYATSNRLYVGTGVARSIVVFERDPTTGLLSFIEAKVDEMGSVSLLNDPEGMTVSRDHRFIYATGDEDDGITVFQDLQAPLPVELVYFKGETRKGQAILHWKTASEIQNEGFFIERSSNLAASKWETLDFVKGHGDKLSPSLYQYQDDSNLKGTYYYRLRQKDWDGTMNFSEVIVLSFDEKSAVLIYPNPSKDFLTIGGISMEEIKSISIFSIEGKLVKSLLPTTTTIALSDLPNGRYFIEIQAGNSRYIEAFIKQ